MRKFYKITLILMVLFLSNIAAFSQLNILYVSKEMSNPADSLLMDYLQYEAGYTIVFKTSAEFKDASFADAAAYVNYDAMYIGEAISSGDAHNFHLAGYPIPIVNTEGWAYKTGSTKWNWLSDEDNQFHQLGGDDGATAEQATSLVFMGDETTWLGRQYEDGQVVKWSEAQGPKGYNGSNGIAFDYDIDDAIPIAYIPADSLGEDKPVMWAFPEGTAVTTDPNVSPVDVTLPAAMVYLGTIDAAMDSATAEFHALVHNSFQWVTGTFEESVNEVKSNALKVWPNPTNGMVNISLELPVSGTVSINIYDITGKLMQTVDSDYYSAGDNIININLSDMAGALYYYEIITDNDLYSGKIVKN